MLNIKPKNEAMQALESNKKRFDLAKEAIFELNKARDYVYLHEQVIPKFLSYMVLLNFAPKLEPFSFSIPFIDFGDHALNDGEKENIINTYYLNQSLFHVDTGRMRTCKSGVLSDILSEGTKKAIGFSKCEIDLEHNIVHLEIFKNDELIEKKLKKSAAFEDIRSFIDDKMSKYINVETVSKKINELHTLLSSEQTVAVLDNDLQDYRLFEINMDEIVGNKINSHYGIPKTEKIHYDRYFDHNELVKSLQKNFNKHGYDFYLEPQRLDKEFWFRKNGFTLVLKTKAIKNKPKKGADLITGPELENVLAVQQARYQALILQRCLVENEKLVQQVNVGQFSSYIAEQLAQFTVLYPFEITKALYGEPHREYKTLYENEVTLTFIVDFDREIEQLTGFNRHTKRYHGLGHAYMALQNNVISAMAAKYPFLQTAKAFGAPHSDYRHWDGVLNSDECTIHENSFSFSYKLGKEYCLANLDSIFNFLSSHYGTLDADGYMKRVNLNEEGVSNGINDYIMKQTTGEISKQESFHLLFAEINHDELTELFEQSSLCDELRNLYISKFTRHVPFEVRGDALVRKNEGRYSLRLANLLCYSLVSHGKFKALSALLAEQQYALKLFIVQEEMQHMDTGKKSLPGDPIWDDIVSKYKLQIVIQ